MDRAPFAPLQAVCPDQNVVLVKRDFSNLKSAMGRLLQRDEEVKRIAQNSVQTFRETYLTPAAQICYWRRMITVWAKTCKFEPRLYVEEDQAGRLEKARGTPYESFVANLIDPCTVGKLACA